MVMSLRDLCLRKKGFVIDLVANSTLLDSKRQQADGGVQLFISHLIAQLK
jgi:hypothetical protein